MGGDYTGCEYQDGGAILEAGYFGGWLPHPCTTLQPGAVSTSLIPRGNTSLCSRGALILMDCKEFHKKSGVCDQKSSGNNTKLTYFFLDNKTLLKQNILWVLFYMEFSLAKINWTLGENFHLDHPLILIGYILLD